MESEPIEGSLKSELQIAIEQLSGANLESGEISNELSSLEALSSQSHDLVIIAGAWLDIAGGELGNIEAKPLLVEAEGAADECGDWLCCVQLIEKLPDSDGVNACLRRRWLEKAEDNIQLSFDAEYCAMAWVRFNVEESKSKAFALLKCAEELLKQEIMDFFVDPPYAAEGIQQSWGKCFGEELGAEYSKDFMSWVKVLGDQPWLH